MKSNIETARDTRFTLAPSVLMQRDIRLPPGLTLREAVSTNASVFSIENTDDSVIVLSAKGSLYEVNLTGSLLLESALSGQSCAEGITLLEEFFGIERERAIRDATEFYDQLVRSAILRKL
jgi:hypothetical protein